MSKLQEILKSQEEELRRRNFLEEDIEYVKGINAQIIKTVTEEMTGVETDKMLMVGGKESFSSMTEARRGYNRRVQEEITKAHELREEVEGK